MSATATIEKLPNKFWRVVVRNEHQQITDIFEARNKRNLKKWARACGATGTIKKIY